MVEIRGHKIDLIIYDEAPEINDKKFARIVEENEGNKSIISENVMWIKFFEKENNKLKEDILKLDLENKQLKKLNKALEGECIIRMKKIDTLQFKMACMIPLDEKFNCSIKEVFKKYEI